MGEGDSRMKKRRGMTMIEVIVVAVILGLLAALTMPRLMGGEARRVRARAEEAAHVLTSLARRDAMLSQPLALEYSRDEGLLRVLVRSADPDSREPWQIDRLLPKADLRDVMLSTVEVDGAQADAANLRVVLDQFSPRPSLRLVLTDQKGVNPVTILLSTTAGQAGVVEGDVASLASSGVQPVDLDASGRDQERW
jgi:prepilin-type N-terminal cleavage/methylation domain-containing protein